MKSLRAPSDRLGLFVILLAGLAMAALWSVAGLALASDRQLSLESGTASLRATAELIAGKTRGTMDQVRGFLQFSDRVLMADPAMDPRTDASFAGLVGVVRSNTGNQVDIRFVSGDGKLYYLGDPASAPRAEVGDRDYYQAQLDPARRGFHIAESVQSRVTKLWGIPVSYPLSVPRNGVSILFAAIELPFVISDWEATLTMPSEIVSLIRSDGLVLATAPFDLARVGADIAQGELWRKHLPASPNGVVRLDNPLLDSVPRLVAWKTVPGYPLVVTVSVREDAALVGWRLRLWISIVVVVLASALIGFLALRVRALIAERAVQAERMERLASTDSLTGLANRRSVFEQGAVEFERSRRHGRPFACLMIDLDHFKCINDSFGHARGDAVLVALAGVLRGQLRDADCPGRIGGEEFLVLLPETDGAGAMLIAERIRQAAASVVSGNGPLRVSVGVAEASPGDAEFDRLVRRADEALYQAKANGRDQVVFAA